MKALLFFSLFAIKTFSFEWTLESSVEFGQYKNDQNEQTEDKLQVLENKLSVDFAKNEWGSDINISSNYNLSGEMKNLIVLEDANLSYEWSEFSFILGLKSFNFSIMDAFHPVDVINSRVLTSTIKDIKRRGEFVIGVESELFETALYLYFMPMVLDPIFPRQENRLSIAPSNYSLLTPLYIDSEGARVKDEKSVSQFFFAVEKTLSQIDYFFSYVDHIDRNQPVSNVNIFKQEVQPVYSQVRRWMFSAQRAYQDFVFRFEYAQNKFSTPDFLLNFQELKQKDHEQLAFGGDYSYEHNNGKTSNFTLELQKFLSVNETERAGLGVFQNDLFIGYRLSFNDTLSKELSFNLIYDLDKDEEFLLLASYSQRLNDYFSFSIDVRFVEAGESSGQAQGLEVFKDDNVVSSKLTYFF